MTGDGYEGPDHVAFAKWPGRGTIYRFLVAGHDIEVYVTEKKKLIRIHVDGTEWEAREDA